MLTPTDFPKISAIPHALQAVLAEIMRREGTRFENDLDDPGGATCCGISLTFARDVHLDLDGNGRTNLDDIKAVTPEMAQRLIYQRFYLDPHVDRLPGPVQPFVLDTAFNCGVSGAAAVLVEALAECGLTANAGGAALGGYGPLLEKAISDRGAAAVLDILVRKRIMRYRRIVDHRPASVKYFNGWLMRSLHFASQDLRQSYAVTLATYGETP